MVEARTRGYFGIGAEGISKSANVGALLRTGHAFGAAFCFTIGTGWDSRAARTADTADTPLHVPMWRYAAVADLSLPRGCALVGIELLDDAVDLPSFRHPLNAAYVLGPERQAAATRTLRRTAGRIDGNPRTACRHRPRRPPVPQDKADVAYRWRKEAMSGARLFPVPVSPIPAP